MSSIQGQDILNEQIENPNMSIHGQCQYWRFEDLSL